VLTKQRRSKDVFQGLRKRAHLPHIYSIVLSVNKKSTNISYSFIRSELKVVYHKGSGFNPKKGFYVFCRTIFLGHWVWMKHPVLVIWKIIRAASILHRKPNKRNAVWDPFMSPSKFVQPEFQKVRKKAEPFQNAGNSTTLDSHLKEREYFCKLIVPYSDARFLSLFVSKARTKFIRGLSLAFWYSPGWRKAKNVAT